MKTKIALILLIGILFTFYANEFLPAQSKITTDTTQTEVTKDTTNDKITNIGQIDSFWQLTALGGIFRWFIFLTLAIGLLLVVVEVVKIVHDNLNAKSVLLKDFKTLQLDELITFFRQQKKSFVAKVGVTLTEVFEKTASVQGFSEEISNSIKQREQKFDSFTTGVNFLSDTAGALGLLGTVWGMFVTFFSETWDTTTILRGMGIALVTTLLGLIVSIILNFCSTIIFRLFNQNLGNATAKADELRLALLSLKFVKRSSLDESNYKQPFSLMLESEKKLINPVNQPLDKPIRVKLIDANSVPIPDKTITFEMLKGTSTFADGQRTYEVQTDANGQAEVRFTLGKEAGQHVILCFDKELENSQLEIKIDALPGAAAKLQRISKKNQSVFIEEKLSSPLMVALFDSFDNPIADHLITFKTTGSGFFKKGQQTVQVHTNNDGQAAVDFFAGSESEIYTISAFAKTLEDKAVEFTILSEEKEG